MADPVLAEQWRAYRRDAARVRRKAAKVNAEIAARERAIQSRYWAKLRADPERYEAHKATKRAQYAAIKADVERYRERRALERAAWRARQFDAGRTPHSKRSAVDAYDGHRQGPYLDAGPFAAWIDATFPDSPFADIAATLRIPERRVYAVRTGEQRCVSFELADRALTAYGDPWLIYRLWPSLLDDTKAAA